MHCMTRLKLRHEYKSIIEGFLLQVPVHVRDQIKSLALLGYRGENSDTNTNGQQNGKASQEIKRTAAAA